MEDKSKLMKFTSKIGLCCFVVTLLFLSLLACQSDSQSNNTEMTEVFDSTSVDGIDSIEYGVNLIPAGIEDKVSVVKKKEEVLQEKHAEYVEEQKEKSRLQGKSCEEILKLYQSFLNVNSERLKIGLMTEELETFIKDPYFVECDRNNGSFRVSKDDLEEMYL